jgi:peptide deformylase
MAIRRIIELGDPLLRATSRQVSQPSEAEEALCDLRDTLHEFQRTHGFGRGIAAIQIGVPLRVIYIEIHGQCYELINPRLEWASEEKFRLWDDCFSFPNLMVELDRHQRIRVRYQDRAGHARQIEAEGDFSELLQHELDHLDGILSIDRVVDPRSGFATRSQYLRTLEQN